jgi:AcrR family transcriptional regulator
LATNNTPDPTTPRRRLPAEERRTIVLEAARRAFVASGFGGATMRSIAAEAGIDQAMLYRFFESKEKLFEEAIATPLQQAVDHTLAASLRPPGGDSEDVRERSIQATRELLQAMREIAPLLSVVLTIDEQTGTRFYRERFEPTLNQIRDVVIANVALFPHGDFSPELVVRVFFGTCWFIALDDRFGSGPTRSGDELAVELVGIVLDGLLARRDS